MIRVCRYDLIYYVVLCLRLYKQNVAQRHLSSLLFLRHIFNVDTVVKPLPPSVAYNVSRNLTFTRIFTQFFDPDGIVDAQKSLGLGQEEKVRKVRQLWIQTNIHVLDERFMQPWFGRISSIKVAKAHRHNFYLSHFASVRFMLFLPSRTIVMFLWWSYLWWIQCNIVFWHDMCDCTSDFSFSFLEHF